MRKADDPTAAPKSIHGRETLSMPPPGVSGSTAVAAGQRSPAVARARAKRTVETTSQRVTAAQQGVEEWRATTTRLARPSPWSSTLRRQAPIATDSSLSPRGGGGAGHRPLHHASTSRFVGDGLYVSPISQGGGMDHHHDDDDSSRRVPARHGGERRSDRRRRGQQRVEGASHRREETNGSSPSCHNGRLGWGVDAVRGPFPPPTPPPSIVMWHDDEDDNDCDESAGQSSAGHRPHHRDESSRTSVRSATHETVSASDLCALTDKVAQCLQQLDDWDHRLEMLLGDLAEWRGEACGSGDGGARGGGDEDGRDQRDDGGETAASSSVGRKVREPFSTERHGDDEEEEEDGDRGTGDDTTQLRLPQHRQSEENVAAQEICNVTEFLRGEAPLWIPAAHSALTQLVSDASRETPSRPKRHATVANGGDEDRHDDRLLPSRRRSTSCDSSRSKQQGVVVTLMSPETDPCGGMQPIKGHSPRDWELQERGGHLSSSSALLKAGSHRTTLIVPVPALSVQAAAWFASRATESHPAAVGVTRGTAASAAQRPIGTKLPSDPTVAGAGGGPAASLFAALGCLRDSRLSEEVAQLLLGPTTNHHHHPSSSSQHHFVGDDVEAGDGGAVAYENDDVDVPPSPHFYSSKSSVRCGQQKGGIDEGLHRPWWSSAREKEEGPANSLLHLEGSPQTDGSTRSVVARQTDTDMETATKGLSTASGCRHEDRSPSRATHFARELMDAYTEVATSKGAVGRWGDVAKSREPPPAVASRSTSEGSATTASSADRKGDDPGDRVIPSSHEEPPSRRASHDDAADSDYSERRARLLAHLAHIARHANRVTYDAS